MAILCSVFIRAIIIKLLRRETVLITRLHSHFCFHILRKIIIIQDTFPNPRKNKFIKTHLISYKNM